MKKPFVISVSGLSGGGKTAVANALKKRLSNSALLCLDGCSGIQLDRNINDWPADTNGESEWAVEPLAKELERLLKKSLSYIIIDCPFGCRHRGVGKYINFAVFVDTPPDGALARARPTYLRMQNTQRPISDFVTDGMKTPEEIADEVINEIGVRRRSGAMIDDIEASSAKEGSRSAQDKKPQAEKTFRKDIFYHASNLGGLTVLLPLSATRGKKEPVCYFTPNREYALFYLRDMEINHVTCGVDAGGTVVYHEQFPKQLAEIYGNRSGYLYSCAGTDRIKKGHTGGVWVSTKPVAITGAEYIDDVYAAILEAEKKTRFALSGMKPCRSKRKTK